MTPFLEVYHGSPVEVLDSPRRKTRNPLIRECGGVSILLHCVIFRLGLVWGYPLAVLRSLVRLGSIPVCLWALNSHFGSLTAASEPTFSESITCASAFQIGQWGWAKSPAEKAASLEDSLLARKVLERFVEAADPSRVLFLQSDVDAFIKDAPAHWKAFVTEQRCSAFEGWLATHYSKGKQRFQSLLSKVSAETAVPADLSEHGDDENDAYPTYLTFAKEEGELAKRVSRFAISVVRASSRKQLEAFKGDKKALVQYLLNRMLFDDVMPPPVHLLTRAFVGSIDPFSDYFSDDEYSEFYRDLVGGTSGVGVKVREVPSGLLIQKVVSDSPAGKSKLIQPGDTIVAVNDEVLAGLPSRRLRHVLEGDEGSPIFIKLAAREGKPERTLKLIRRSFAFEDARVSVKQVRLRNSRKSQVSVIHIPSFYGRGGNGAPGERSSAEDVETALKNSMKTKPSAIVLDMRGNPGGYLEEAVSMAGLFLGNRPVVAVVEPGMRRILRDHHVRALYNGPLLVLVDDQSASAAEVLAGALKDYQRAVVLGAPTTYGKGSVQRLFHLDTGLIDVADSDRQGVLKMTTSFFYSPLGHSPANGGIVPHLTLGSVDAMKKPAKRQRRRQAVPEQEPFVDAATLSRIHLQERLMESRIAALKESGAARAQDVRGVFEQAVKKAFGSAKTDEPTRASLAETLAIADEWVAIEGAARSSAETAAKSSENAPH